MSKYSALRRRLESHAGPSVDVTFRELDDIVGGLPASASSTTPGGVTVTVEATPVEVVWDLDEGVRVCDGPGVPWSQGAHAAYELQPETTRGSGNPACTFTFVNASSTRVSGMFDATVTVRWEFSWSLNGVGRGVFGSVEVSDAFELQVGEVQAVITG